MAREKPIPRSQRRVRNRGRDRSRNDDNVKNLSVGLMVGRRSRGVYHVRM
jgi:hypothetical protein